MKVKLLVDLTNYNPGLVAGIEGDTIALYSSGNDCFVPVRFPRLGTLDIWWRSLEITDTDELKRIEQRKVEERAELGRASKVVLQVGPRGGFRYMSYESVSEDGIPMHVGIGIKSEADRVLAILREIGKAFTETQV